MTDRLRAVPAWAWLGAIVLASFGFRGWLARGMVAPFIMVDELIYAELARSVADSGRFLVRGVPASGYSLVYPVLISPAYAVFDSLVQAYDAVKWINAFMMSLAAVPAYLLARRVVPPGLALLGAVLAVALPSMVYTGTVMTENAFYPIFLLAAYALVLVLERPSGARIAALAALVALAFATRVQAVALVPAILLAPLLLALFERRGLRAGLRAYRYLYALVLAGAGLAVLAQVARGRALSDLLGAYAVVGDREYAPGTVLRYALWHLEELTLYLAVVPVAATLVLAVLAFRQPRPLQAFLAAALSVSLFLTLAVAAFASQFANRVQERNLFVIAPFFLIGLLAWVHRGAPRPQPLALAAAGLAAALPLLFPYERFIETAATSDTLALLPIWTAFGSLLRDSIDWTVGLGVLVATALFLLVPRRAAILLPLAVLVWFAVVLKPIWSGPRGFKQASAGALFQGIRGVPRGWIDAALPPGASAAVVWTGQPDRFVVNQNEFFNRRVGPVFYTEAPTPGGIGETKLELDGSSGTVSFPDGRPFTARYALLDGSIDPDGDPVARDAPRGMTVWRLHAPLASVSRIEGLYPADTWSGPTVTYTREPCRGGTLAVGVWSDPTLFSRPQTVTARQTGSVAGRFRLDPGGRRGVFRVELEPRGGACRVVYTVSPTAVPSRVLGTADERELGAHFDGFVLER